eukprot:7727006-Prorocentrum_lima.AAC.1
MVPVTLSCPLASLPGEPTIQHSLPPHRSYVDDFAWMVSADTPEVLLAVLRRSCSAIFKAYRLFGLPLNFAPDKTALMAFFA